MFGLFSLLWFLIIGGVAGWIASRLTGAAGGSPLVMVVIGCVGAVVGPFIVRLFGFKTVAFPASLIAAVIGAVVTIVAIRYLGPKL